MLNSSHVDYYMTAYEAFVSV